MINSPSEPPADEPLTPGEVDLVRMAVAEAARLPHPTGDVTYWTPRLIATIDALRRRVEIQDEEAAQLRESILALASEVKRLKATLAGS